MTHCFNSDGQPWKGECFSQGSCIEVGGPSTSRYLFAGANFFDAGAHAPLHFRPIVTPKTFGAS
jgi:hypothetical protein